jgi:hypothetical protein
VVGWIQQASPAGAYVWSAAAGITFLLNTNYGDYAVGVNNLGVAVGYAGGAVAWPTVNSMVVLTSATGSCCIATAVNDRGQAVGWNSLDNSGTNHAMLWDLANATPQSVSMVPTAPYLLQGQVDAQSGTGTPESCLSAVKAMASKGAFMQCIVEKM